MTQLLPKLFSLYLLLAIEWKEGYKIIDESGINPEIALTLLAVVLMAYAVQIYSFFVLRIKLDIYEATASRLLLSLVRKIHE